MNKFVVRMIVNELSLKDKIRKAIEDRRGSSSLSDNAGLVLLGIALLLIIGTAIIAFTNNDFLPAAKQKLMSLLNMS